MLPVPTDRRAAGPALERCTVLHYFHRALRAATLSVLLAAAAAPAQSLHFGGTIGLSDVTQAHRIAGAPVFSADRLGVQGGISLRADVTPWLALQGEVLYSGKGFEEGPDFEMWVGYLEMPVLARVGAPLSGPAGLRPVVLAGVVPAREISCGGRTVPGHVGGPPPDPVPLDCSGMRTDLFDLGVLAGGGLATRIAGLTLTAEVRYTHGIHDIAGGFEFAEVKNRAVSFLVGATLPLAD